MERREEVSVKNYKEWRAEAARAKIIKGISNKELAESIGYSYKYVVNVLNGYQIGQPCIDAISVALGIDTYRYNPEDLATMREKW